VRHSGRQRRLRQPDHSDSNQRREKDFSRNVRCLSLCMSLSLSFSLSFFLLLACSLALFPSTSSQVAAGRIPMEVHRDWSVCEHGGTRRPGRTLVLLPPKKDVIKVEAPETWFQIRSRHVKSSVKPSLASQR
jgi:hypothetical protein